MPGTRVPSDYSEVKRAFLALWENKGVPTDLRFYMCGAVYQAGVRQGDEVFSRDIFQKILAGLPLTKTELVDMVEGTHEFVVTEDGLRLQHIAIVVHMITTYLEKNMAHVLQELSQPYPHYN